MEEDRWKFSEEFRLRMSQFSKNFFLNRGICQIEDLIFVMMIGGDSDGEWIMEVRVGKGDAKGFYAY